jgi:N-sulfoglucosamine sulfohydrolase
MLMTNRSLALLGAALLILTAGNARAADRTPDDAARPNILWIYIEDMNDWMSCYGDTVIKTPNIDVLAARGVRFNRAYMTAGVCSPVRSGIITGMYQTSIGAHNHYSSFREWRGIKSKAWDPNYLGVRTIPEIFKLADYHTFNEGKFHYNFVWHKESLYDRVGGSMNFTDAKNGSHWTGRKEGWPFFGQIQLVGGKNRRAPKKVSPDDVPVPPYYPDHPVFRKHIAQHYDTILSLDETLGRIIAALKRDNLYDNTIIFFFTDHGMLLPRHKQFLYEGGIRVPLIVAGPGIPEGKVRDDLVSGIDISATSLALAGITIPPHMEGRNMFDPDFHRDFVVAARDRCDYTIDRIRSITTLRYKYIRNFMTDRSYMQPQYRDGADFMKTLKSLHADGKLNEVQSHFVSDFRPAEELYDLKNDPHETKNLVHEPLHGAELGAMRTRLHRWIVETGDQGRFPESDAALKAVVKRWGKRAVNKEYDRVRP